jgi:hypothetical protein
VKTVNYETEARFLFVDVRSIFWGCNFPAVVSSFMLCFKGKKEILAAVSLMIRDASGRPSINPPKPEHV